MGTKWDLDVLFPSCVDVSQWRCVNCILSRKQAIGDMIESKTYFLELGDRDGDAKV